MGVLYVVATPIGNLEDITLRAIRTLREVSLIACEDTRKTKLLLKTYSVKTPITSYHEHNERTKLQHVLRCLEDDNIALVSEAGMPGISDPGYKLISSALAQGNEVVPIPGPSAILTALVVSGLPVHQFIYVGFLPRRRGMRKRLLVSLVGEVRTLVAFESPHRLKESLQDIKDVLGNRRVVICREMTKLHEEVFRSTAAECLKHFDEPRGEFTLVIEGASSNREGTGEITDQIKHGVEELYRRGMRLKDAAECIAIATGVPTRLLYQTSKDLSERSERTQVRFRGPLGSTGDIGATNNDERRAIK